MVECTAIGLIAAAAFQLYHNSLSQFERQLLSRFLASELRDNAPDNARDMLVYYMSQSLRLPHSTAVASGLYLMFNNFFHTLMRLEQYLLQDEVRVIVNDPRCDLWSFARGQPSNDSLCSSSAATPAAGHPGSQPDCAADVTDGADSG